MELEGGTLVGTASLWSIDNHNRSAHIGLGLLPSSRAKGYRTAARVIRLGLPVLAPIDPTRPDQLRLRPQDPVDLGVARSVVGPTRALGG